jgi:hypothetical protein
MTICSRCLARVATTRVVLEGGAVLYLCSRCCWTCPLQGRDEHNRLVLRHEAMA